MPSRLASRMRRVLQIVAALILLATFAGCVRQTTDGATTTFRYETWVPPSVLLAGIAAAPLGWQLRKRSARFGWGLVIAGPLAAFVLAPSLFRDRVTLADDGFHVRTGLWGLSAVHDVKFDEVRTLRIISETTTNRRGRKTNYFFLCEMKHGGSVKVPVNNEVSKAAAEPILRRVAARRIPIINE